MLLDRAQNLFWLANFILSNFLLFTLTTYPVPLLLFITGVVLGIVAFFCTATTENIKLVMDYGTIFMYLSNVVVLLIIISLYATNKAKQIKLNAIQTLSGIIAHDAVSPLATIQMFIELTTEALHNKDYEKIREYINDIEYLALGGIKKTEITLTTLRSISHQIDTNHYSVTETINEAICDYCLAPDDRKRIIFKRGKDFYFRGSKYFIKHVVFNLLKNALQHAGQEAKIEIWLGDHIVYFEDNGKGMPVHIMKNIFKKFCAVSTSNIGLGLNFCAEVMDKIGGRIKCISKKERYTRFLLYFPNLQKKVVLHRNPVRENTAYKSTTTRKAGSLS
ncbi:putative HAMP domain-containing histidine kinase [Alphaproteobacteria bacterium]